jgi:hypothetical protein
MRLLDFREMRRGSLIGFARVRLPIGLTIHDVAVLVSRNSPFAVLPTKARIDTEGRQKRDANGRPAYQPVLEWGSRELSDRFSAAVLSLVRQVCPDAFDRGVP